MNELFDIGAKKHLIDLFPEDGEMRFERLNRFCETAKSDPGSFHVVPSEIEQDLRIVLNPKPKIDNVVDLNEARRNRKIFTA